MLCRTVVAPAFARPLPAPMDDSPGPPPAHEVRPTPYGLWVVLDPLGQVVAAFPDERTARLAAAVPDARLALLCELFRIGHPRP